MAKGKGETADGRRQAAGARRQAANNKVLINGYKKFGYLFADLARNFYLTIHKLINVSLLYNFISGNRKLCLLPCLVPTLVFRVNISSKETTLTMLIKRIWRFFDPDTKPLSESQNDRHHFTRKKGRISFFYCKLVFTQWDFLKCISSSDSYKTQIPVL